MSTHYIHFDDKIKNKSLNICFHELSEEFRRDTTQKRVRISHAKRAIGVQAIEIRLYNINNSCWPVSSKILLKYLNQVITRCTQGMHI